MPSPKSMRILPADVPYFNYTYHIPCEMGSWGNLASYRLGDFLSSELK